MKPNHKTGDKVKLKINSYDGSYLSYGKVYTILRGVDVDGDVLVRDDDGDEDYYPAKYFELAYGDNDIGYAMSVINTSVSVKIDGKITDVVIEGFSVWNKFYDDGSWSELTELINRDGYAVSVEFYNKFGKPKSMLLSEIIQPVSNIVVLNDEYKAVIEGDIVKVGCQDIPIEKIKQILEAYKNLND